MPTLDRDAFTRWLRTLPPDAPFARSRRSSCCPFAYYLRDSIGLKDALVGASAYTVGTSWIDLPEWAQRLIQEIDTGGADELLAYERDVTPREVLEALEKLA